MGLACLPEIHEIKDLVRFIKIYKHLMGVLKAVAPHGEPMSGASLAGY